MGIKKIIEEHPLRSVAGLVVLSVGLTWTVGSVFNSKDAGELERYRETGATPEEIKSQRGELDRYRALEASPEQVRGMLAAAGKPQFADCGPRVVTFPWEEIDTHHVETFECSQTKFTVWLETHRPLVLMGEAPNTDGLAVLHVRADARADAGVPPFECQYRAHPSKGSFSAASGCPFISGPVTIDRSSRGAKPLRLTATFMPLEP